MLGVGAPCPSPAGGAAHGAIHPGPSPSGPARVPASPSTPSSLPETTGTSSPSSTAAARLPLPMPFTRVPLQVLGVKAKLGCRRETSHRGGLLVEVVAEALGVGRGGNQGV